MNLINPTKLAISLALVSAFAATGLAQQDMMMASKSTVFKGVEATGGTVSAEVKNNRIILTLSKDFKAPKTPAPHWQVVDSAGNVYLLKQLKIAGGKMNRSITVPTYVKDVAKVQIWCSFAEVNLGEAMFKTPVMGMGM
jgi:hypothetical protein